VKVCVSMPSTMVRHNTALGDGCRN